MGATHSLRSLAGLRAERPLTVAEALGVLRDVAQALAAGQPHGAVNCESIVLDAGGEARLAGPAQGEGGIPDLRGDISALGAAIAQLLPPEPPAPEPLRRLLATMTAEDPARRPQTPDEVLLGIEACELMAGIRAVRPGQQEEAERRVRRLFPFVIAGLALLVLGLALLAALGRTPPGRGAPPESHKPLLDQLVPIPPKPASPVKP
ncbi:MAG: hypothetical protein FJ291_19560 [Planctomycetes bacterium]|nr:hypothetical protein [Planctomycetota bacterium]